jgi:hypothetical protein
MTFTQTDAAALRRSWRRDPVTSVGTRRIGCEWTRRRWVSTSELVDAESRRDEKAGVDP